MNKEAKREKINDIILDLSYYSGEDLYSDGDVEDTILEACKSDSIDYLLKHSSDYAVFYHLSDLRHNLVEWLPLKGGEHVLEIGSGCGAITGALAQKAKDVVCVDLSKRRSLINAYRNKAFSNINIIVGNFQELEQDLQEYDLITLIGVLEYSPLYIKGGDNPFIEMLALLRKHLKKGGRILIAIENKMGLKYFNGAWEDHTMKQYEGINDYLSTDWVRTFSKQELIKLFNKSGYDKIQFYYPSPDYKIPDTVYSDDRLPKPTEVRTFGKNYQGAQFYNFYDMVVNDQICSDGVFDYFSNSFLVVLGDDLEIKYSKFSRERLPKFKIGTMIKGDKQKKVIKIALSEEAKSHVIQIKDNENKLREELSKFNISLECSEGMLVGDTYLSDYIDGMTLQQDFYEVRHNLDDFVNLAKRYISEYFPHNIDHMHPFKTTTEFKNVFGDVKFETMTMDVTNVDAIFSNMIRDANGSVHLIDCEWVFEFPIPYEYPIWRAITVLHFQYAAYLNTQCSFTEYVKRFGFDDGKIRCFSNMDTNFSHYVCGENNEAEISKKYVKESIMTSNRRF